MFVTVLFGDNRMELCNLNCRLSDLIQHIKGKCGLDSTECVDLMDSSGAVMNLQEKQHSGARASSVLQQRQYYVLLRVCNDVTGSPKYVPLLNSCSQSKPEFVELMRKLSHLKNADKSLRRGGRRTQRSKPGNQTRSKAAPANNKLR
ncbi:uncharacterized protein C22orf15 isoform X2 [Cynoglossus semilaevis]|uniref:uncharacterized protein C22orf15 isoform X2 n=1 Tax=Cynoglossus semilaevis TaxID=244447 RepID=UPI0007DCAD4C|nr:uncharacterized protein C22orf15 homolog isoform X2 [Cynoglossus semilaevis]